MRKFSQKELVGEGFLDVVRGIGAAAKAIAPEIANPAASLYNTFTAGPKEYINSYREHDLEGYFWNYIKTNLSSKINPKSVKVQNPGGFKFRPGTNLAVIQFTADKYIDEKLAPKPDPNIPVAESTTPQKPLPRKPGSLKPVGSSDEHAVASNERFTAKITKSRGEPLGRGSLSIEVFDSKGTKVGSSAGTGKSPAYADVIAAFENRIPTQNRTAAALANFLSSKYDIGKTAEAVKTIYDVTGVGSYTQGDGLSKFISTVLGLSTITDPLPNDYAAKLKQPLTNPALFLFTEHLSQIDTLNRLQLLAEKLR